MTHQPHDHLVRSIFGQPERAAAELRAVLPGAVLAQLDLATLKAVPGSFVDDALRGRAADLLFTVTGRGSGDPERNDPAAVEHEWIIHLLLEHQSRVDRWLPLRLLEYQLRIWERWRREHPEADRLPPIVTVVLYHGKRAWPHPTNFSHLLDRAGDRGGASIDGSVDFQFFLDDLTRSSDSELSGRAVDAASLLTLLALKHARSTTDLRARLLDWVSLIGAVARAPGGREVLLLVLRYLVLVNERISSEFLQLELAPQLDDAVAKETTMTLGERLIAEGRDLERRDMLLKQLRRRFGELPAESIEHVRKAPLDRVEEWALRIFEARSLAEALAD